LNRLFRDWIHLIRPAAVLIAALGIFMIVRAAVIPKDFGKYGHFRPGALKPTLPDVANLCRRCHERDAARPATFPQVVTLEHSGGAVCTTCHVPHNPHL